MSVTSVSDGFLENAPSMTQTIGDTTLEQAIEQVCAAIDEYLSPA